MSMLEVFAVLITVAVCVYASYTDVRLGKIPNLYTYGLVLFGIVCQGIFVYTGIATIWHAIWLLVGGLAAGFLMYYLGIWSPGDSKLFWAISMALPPTLYTVGPWRYPPVVVAINTFVPYFLIAMIYILIRTSGRQKLQVARNVLNPKFLLQLSLSFLSFMGFSSLVTRFLPLDLDYFTQIILFILLFSLLNQKVDPKKQFYVLLPFSLVTIIMAFQNITFFVRVFLITLGIFLVLRFFVAALASHLFVKEVDISNLEKGDMPANIIVRNRDGQYVTQDVAYTSFVNIAQRPKDAEVIMDMCPEGLSAEKVAELKNLAAQGLFNPFGNKIKVQGRLPFAPIILCGTVLTVLCRGVFVVPLISLLQK